MNVITSVFMHFRGKQKKEGKHISFKIEPLVLFIIGAFYILLCSSTSSIVV